MEDYFHPIVLSGSFIGLIVVITMVFSQFGATYGWWKGGILLVAAGAWDFGWHLNRHHKERAVESWVWRAVGVVLAMMGIFLGFAK